MSLPFTNTMSSFARPGQESLDRARIVAASPLGIGMTSDACFAIAAKTRVKRFARGHAPFLQGDGGQRLMLITSGYVKLTQVSPEGKEVLLWMCGPGHVLGIRSELTGNPYSCSAEAIKTCTLLVWEHDALSGLTHQYPRLMQNLNGILLTRIEELEERFRELATENVSRRLAFTLLRLSRHIGSAGDGGIEIYLSRQEIARMTGTTLFSVSRILSEWGRDKLVLPRRNSVILPDLALIEKMAAIDSQPSPNGNGGSGRAKSRSFAQFEA
jgi:CRP/FNR family transcriptional regulator, nitrogen oxide reductase regulator